MSIALTINGQVFQYPEPGDSNWGVQATLWASAVTTGMLQKAGGTFTLTAEVDFGASFGIKSLYYKTRTANIADAGQFRLARADVISWRNQANGANLDLSVNASNELLFNGVQLQNFVSVTDTDSIDLTLAAGVLEADLKLSAAAADAGFFKATASIETDGLLVQAEEAASGQTGFLTAADWARLNTVATLPDTQILIGSALGVSTARAMSGDATLSNLGVLTIANSAVSNAKMANMANNTIKGNDSGGAAAPQDLTGTEVTALLDPFVGDSGAGGTKGLVPAPIAGDATKFLAGDGTWTTPPGAGDVVGPASATANAVVLFDGTTGKLVKDSGSFILTSSLEFQNISLAVSAAAGALTIAVKDASGSDCSAASPGRISFRSATQTSGLYVLRTITGALSMTVSSGSTLGHNGSSLTSPVYIYALDNAGTVELACSTALFNDNTIQSTTAEGGAGAADSPTVMYSTTARSNVAVRLIGVGSFTLATAGTWLTPDSVSVVPLNLRPNSYIYAYGGNGVGGSSSGDTRSRNFTTAVTVGTAIFRATRSTTASDFFILCENGLFSIANSDQGSAQGNFGVTVNGAGSTAIGSQSPPTVLTANLFQAGLPNTCSVSGVYLKCGDILRAQNDGSGASNGTSANQVNFWITHIAKG